MKKNEEKLSDLRERYSFMHLFPLAFSKSQLNTCHGVGIQKYTKMNHDICLSSKCVHTSDENIQIDSCAVRPQKGGT